MLLHESAAMEQSVPENLSTNVFFACVAERVPKSLENEHCSNSNSESTQSRAASATPTTVTSNSNSNTCNNSTSNNNNNNSTKVKLSFSVDRLLSAERSDPQPLPNPIPTGQCCDSSIYACCTFPSCFGQTTTEGAKHPATSVPASVSNLNGYSYAGLDKFYPGVYLDYKSVVRPTPIHAAEHATSFPTLATNALMRFHQQQQQQQQHPQQQQHLHPQQQQQHKAAGLLHGSTSAAAAALLAPLSSLKSLQLTQQQRFLGKATQQHLDLPTAATGVLNNNNNYSNNTGNNNSSNGSGNSNSHSSNGKRKRSWSRAVFTNLQRKGLEIQFQQQKYITKPDRRKLAARLNLTDAQVKVWFQNRRMKWRHTRENLKSGHEKQPPPQQHSSNNNPAKPLLLQSPVGATPTQDVLDYSSDSCSSVELSERADDDDNIEIDVVE